MYIKREIVFHFFWCAKKYTNYFSIAKVYITGTFRNINWDVIKIR